MRTLAPFLILCLLLAGVVTWMAQRSHDAIESAQTDAAASLATTQPPAADSPEPAAPATGPRLPETPEPETQTLSAQEAPITTPTRWVVDDPDAETKQRFIALRKLLLDDSHNEGALEEALELARQLDWHNEACDLLSNLLHLRPDDDPLRARLAGQLMALRRWVEAIPHLRQLADKNPQDVRTWHNLAIAHQALGHLRDAYDAWTHVLELTPDSGDAYARRGEVLLDLHDWSAAADDLLHAHESDIQALDVVLNLSIALEKTGELTAARVPLLARLDEEPNHIALLNRLAELSWALYEEDPQTAAAERDEAIRYARQSLEIDADQPDLTAFLQRIEAAPQPQ